MGPAQDPATELVEAVKPKLRGWLHAGTFPLALVAGAVLVARSPTRRARWASVVYGLSAAALFGTSALYHRGRWTGRADAVLRRLDHANIFLLIAGSYTPFALLLLDGQRGATLLRIVWLGAVLGVLFRVLWMHAPRSMSTAVYIALGWVAVFYLREVFRRGGPAVGSLLVVGGLLYSMGGLVYALKRPDPHPQWFGFHEVFHAFTLSAWAAHYVAISLVTYRTRRNLGTDTRRTTRLGAAASLP